MKHLPAPSGAYQRCPPFRGRVTERSRHAERLHKSDDFGSYGRIDAQAAEGVGFFDLNRRYESLTEKNDPLVAIAAMVPFEILPGQSCIRR